MSDVAPIAKTSSMNPVEGSLTDLQAAGHVAGDIASTAGGIIGSFITPLLPNNVKQRIGDVTKYVSDKVNSIPGMTPEIAKGLGDVFNTLTLKGGESVAPTVQEGIQAGAKSIGEGASNLAENTSNIAGKGVGMAKKAVGTGKELFKPSLSPEEAAGQIIQGEKSDIPYCPINT